MIYPMFAMVILIFLVGLITLRVRFASVLSGRMSIKYYRLMQGDAEDIVIKTTRTYNNMFEIPVLFYTISILFIIFQLEDTIAITIAWLFVATRCIQAYINITYNNVRHRMIAFWASCTCVLILWGYLIALKQFQ